MAEEVKQEATEQGGEKKEPVTQVIISVFEDGSINVNVPEGGRELQPFEIEMLTRNVSEQLRDQRVAQQAVELFKARL